MLSKFSYTKKPFARDTPYMNTPHPSQSEKSKLFRTLHEQNGGFIIPNPWDAGSARLLELLGFKAVATTSAGFAFSRGRPDNSVPRAPLLAHLAEIVAATNLPVSADLENGFGDAPADVAETILLAAQSGVVGGSIEDATGKADDPLYGRDVAAERIRAAVEAARSLPFHFTVTARADNYFVGNADLTDTIGRLQAYQEAGADVLFAPGLSRTEDIATVLREVDIPVNVLMGFPCIGVNELIEMGVKRLSVGGSLARAAYGEFLRAAEELRDLGTTQYVKTAISAREINRMLQNSK